MTSVMVKLIALLISLLMIISGCGNGDTEYNDSSAEVSTESSGEVSDGESSDESLDESTDPAEDSSFDESIDASEDSSKDESSTEDSSSEVESNDDVSDDSSADESSAEVSEPQPDVPNDSSSSAPENDTSKPAEDASAPVEDLSKPAEDTKPAECEHEYITAKKKAPTCTEDGIDETYCKYCKLVKSSEGIQRLGHSFGGWIIKKEATADDEGIKYRTCVLCRYNETESIPKLEIVRVAASKDDEEWIANRVIELLNEERAKLGAPKLVTAPIAHQMATKRAVQISENFSHEGANQIYLDFMYNPNNQWGQPDGGGENIAITGFSTRDHMLGSLTTKEELAEKIVEQFKGSYGHWYDLTNSKYTAVGVGIYIVDSEIGTIGRDAYTAIMTLDKLYGDDVN